MAQMDQETFLTLLSRDLSVNLEVLREVYKRVAEYLGKEAHKGDMADEQAWERIKPGQKILLEIPTGEFKGKYMSQIVRRGQSTVYAAIPRNENGLIKIPPDTETVVRFQNEDIIVGFKSVTGGYLQTDPPSFNLNLLSGLIIKSLRKYHRVKSRIVCQVVYIPPGKEETKETKKIKGLIKDISAGGVRLAAPAEDIERGQTINLTFEVPGSGVFENIESQVVYLSERSTEQVECGVQFKTIDAEQRDKIAQYVSKQLLP